MLIRITIFDEKKIMLTRTRILKKKNMSQTNGFWWFWMIFFFEQLQQTLQNPMSLEEKTFKIIGFYKVFCISMHPTTTNVDTYNDFWREKIMLTRTRICDEKKTYPKPMDFDDFWWFFSSDHFSKRYKIQWCWKKKHQKRIGYLVLRCVDGLYTIWRFFAALHFPSFDARRPPIRSKWNAHNGFRRPNATKRIM